MPLDELTSVGSRIPYGPPLGLSTAEAKKLQTKHGYNELPIKDPRGLFRTFTQVVSEPMFSLLLVASFIYLFLGDIEDAIMLAGFMVASIGITIYQERKSEKAIEALKDLSSPRALVIRDGQLQRIAGREVVVGDLLALEEGDRIAADAIVLEDHDLLLDESLLTGESEPVAKHADQSVFSGSLVVRGGGMVLVQNIGIQTEIGKIGKSLSKVTNIESPLQSDIRVLIKRFAIFGITLSTLVLLIYGLRYQDWLQGALSGISLTMSLLPQEFTVIFTVFMALGVWRIAKQHVLTRHSPVIETLGSITALCVDKTGTLTLNKMSLQALATNNAIKNLASSPKTLDTQEKELLSYATLASEVAPYDPMEKAFHESTNAYNPGHWDSYGKYFIIHEYGLSPKLPAMTHIWTSPENINECLIAMKGSPEAVMNLCKLSSEEKNLVEKQIKKLADQGLRLLGVAKSRYQKSVQPWPDSITEYHFKWLGLVGLKDPLRPEVPASIKQCHDAGIRVLMITGDHALTAKAIAGQAGIKSSSILSGADLDLMDDEALKEAIKTVAIYVRIKPEQKLRLVRSLQENQQIVAMTGDGINDAPALKAAHVGIAMGKRGTDVAREASSLVLLNDDFSSIVNTIHQGRQIYDNLHKAIIYVVAVHIPIAGAVFIPLLIGAPPMLTLVHILFLEMIIDPSCAIVFEMEEPESNVMKRPPRKLDQKVFNFNNLSLAIFQGLGLMTIVVTLYLSLLHLDYPTTFASTIAFGSLVLGNLLLIIVSRSSHLHFFKILKIPNAAQYWIIGIASSLFLILLSTPFLRGRLHLSALTIDGAALILFSGALGLLWHEIVKIIYRVKK